MKQKYSIRFNKIWIIESLKNDSKTGRNLKENISDYLDYEDKKYKDRDVSVVYKTPNTKQEFLDVLDEILCEAENVYPIIHLECHGRGRGLETADGKFVAWHELSDIFRKINRACRLNLLIVAACKGLYLINTFKQLAGGTPYCAVIGAETVLKAGDIEKDFSAFYTEFFKELEVVG